MAQDRSDAIVMLQQAGETRFGDDVRVKKVKKVRATVARATLSLRSGTDRFERVITFADAPDAAKGALEDATFDASARPTACDALPEALRRAVLGAVEDERALGYDAVDLVEVRVREEELWRVRYRRDRRPWLEVWIGTARPRVVGYENGRGMYGRARGWSGDARPIEARSKREQVAWAVGFVLWFAGLAMTLFEGL